MMDSLRSAGALVVVAAPGAGKTTRIPPAVYRSGILTRENPGVIALQPRRIATRALASRIAAENNWQLGGRVGYQVRMENCTGPDTQIIIMTEGILNRRLQSDPALDGIGAVILDEFHMRTLHLDEALAMLSDVRAHLRPDLKLIISSATIDAGPVADFLAAPCMEIPGRMFPVQIRYAPPAGRSLEMACRDAVEDGLQLTDARHVLIFLPGVYEIQRVAQQLTSVARHHGLRICPLHGSQPLAEQAVAISPSKERKVILATNVAETSLTVDGVTLVIDSGLARYADYDPHRGINRLSTRRISQASAQQRAGRAGRTAPGTCIRLWDPAQWKHQPPADPPEIERVDLSNLCLNVYAWNPTGFESLKWLTVPPAAGVRSAQDLLCDLGAASGGGDNFKLTELGRRLVNFPLHPRLSRILVAGIENGHAAWAALIAALLSDAGSTMANRRDGGSWDIAFYLRQAAEDFSALNDRKSVGGSQSGSVLQLFRRLCRQCRVSEQLPPMPSPSFIAKLVCVGFPDRLCVMDRRDPRRGVMVGGTGVELGDHRGADLAEALIALDIDKNDDRQRHAIIRLAARLSAEDILASDAPQLSRKKMVIWDDEHWKVSAFIETHFADLCIKSQPDPSPDTDSVRRVIEQGMLPHLRHLLNTNPALISLANRVELFRRHTARAEIPELTAEYLAKTTVDFMTTSNLREAPDERRMKELYLAALPPDIRHQLDSLLPEYLVLPSGKRVEIDYTSEGPVMEARVVDLLGTASSPKLLGGRVAVICRILGPNYRPVQTTADLAGFWRGSYHQIRKDLRARYPRHPWPEDPLTYVPPVRPGRR